VRLTIGSGAHRRRDENSLDFGAILLKYNDTRKSFNKGVLLPQNKTTGEFQFNSLRAEPAGTVLHDKHLEMVAKSRLADFAGYLMPIRYSSISGEHSAVRNTAGIFDCTHMGVLAVEGSDACGFLNTVCTNDVSSLNVGRAQYSCVLDAAGNVLDDVIVYRIADDKYIVVVNAANNAKLQAYFKGLLADEVLPDAEDPEKTMDYKPRIRDLRDPANGADCLVDIAVQGPASNDILYAASEDQDLREAFEKLKFFGCTEVNIAGAGCIIARTGYTGARSGFELFVHPEKAPEMWDRFLTSGRAFGLLPCGLGARDSLRIEAGLPLYGHELNGSFNISPIEAGYAWAVKLQKDFFIGKTAMQKKFNTFEMKVVRIEVQHTRGIRPMRPGDAVLSRNGHCIGWLLSSARADDKQFGLGFVDKERIEKGAKVGIYYLARNNRHRKQGRLEKVDKQQQVEADVSGEVASRFEKF